MKKLFIKSFFFLLSRCVLFCLQSLFLYYLINVIGVYFFGFHSDSSVLMVILSGFFVLLVVVLAFLALLLVALAAFLFGGIYKKISDLFCLNLSVIHNILNK